MATKKYILASGKTSYVALTRNVEGNDAWDAANNVPAPLASTAWVDLGIVATEQGVTGYYRWTIPANLPSGTWTATSFQQRGVTRARTDIPVWSEPFEWDGDDVINDASLVASIQALNAKITSQTITVIDPTRVTGVLTILSGDDYSADEDRAFGWSTTTAAMWPDLTGADVFLVLQRNQQFPDEGVESLEVDGVVVTPTGANKSVRVPMSAVESFDLCPSGKGGYPYTYRLRAELENGHIVTLATGSVTVVEPAIFTPPES